MSEVTSMDSTFSGCSSLESVILDGVDSRNLQTLDFLFKNYQNLKNINLSPLNILNVNSMNSLFQGCQNLTVNISTFPKINNNFILGPYSNITLIANEKIYDILNALILNNININLNITIYVEQFLDDSCEKGDKEKCKTCCNNLKGNCFLCNDGYYLPIDSNNKKVCSTCSIKKHCIKCIGLSSYILCQECEEGYTLENNICKSIDDTKEEENEENNESEKENESKERENEEEKEKENDKRQEEEGREEEKEEEVENKRQEDEEREEEKQQIVENKRQEEEGKEEENVKESHIPQEEKNQKEGEKEEEEEKEEEKKEEGKEKEELCIVGEGEKCKVCKEEKWMKNQCSECNEGYYQSQNLKCESCKLGHCISCSGSLNNPTCNECEIGFKLISNKCEKKSCIIGINEKCLSCKDYSEECLSCNDGYFIPYDSTEKTKCIKCPLYGCKTCSGNIMNNKCTECFKYSQIKDGKIIICSDQMLVENCSKYDKNNKCVSCNNGYKLIEEKCILIENTFYAVYKIVSTENPTKIMDNYHLHFQLSELTMYDDGEIVYPSITENGYIVYTFKSLGLHNVTFSIHKTLYGCIAGCSAFVII